MSDPIKTVIAAPIRECFGPDSPHEWVATRIIAALKAGGRVVIQLPEVAHKGPHDTDAKFFRQVADRMEKPTRRVDYLSGSNVRNAVRELLYRAADAAEVSR